MLKFFTPLASVLAAGIILAGIVSAPAQQTPAATQPTAPAKPKTAPAAKPKSATTAGAKTAVPLTLKTQKEKFSYALGMNLGTGLHKQAIPVDPAILARGLKDAMAGGKMLMNEDEARAIMKGMQEEMQKKQLEEMHAAGAPNRKIGEDFLAANKTKEGVTTLPSGMQYKILTAGTGPKPSAADTVVCNYRGTFIDGKEFDSSYKRGEPATFAVNGVIKGWVEALQLMPVGSKWQLFIPSEMAYGDRGMGNDIPPGTTLIFEVELMSIQNKSSEEKK
jgi:FKBP-type peptidyl-prolyl cis-trans isomerase FklB